MRKKSPISVVNVLIRTYFRPIFDEDEDITYIYDFEYFDYDGRHDFEVDNLLEGLSVKLEIYNETLVKGSRRKVEVSLIDLNTRCEVASQTINVNIPKERVFREYYLQFPTDTTALVGNHNYRLTVTDCKTSEILADTVIHLFDTDVYGAPEKWYEVIEGSIKPSWEFNTYKSLKTIDDHLYNIRFVLSSKLKPVKPAILPELELRLHYPDGKRVKTQFMEPKYYGFEHYKDDILTLDYPFETGSDANGIFYAELLCMELPIAGFVFDTEGEAIAGAWFDREIEPLEEYSPEAAAERLKEFMPAESPFENDDNFDNLLQDFINSQNKEADKATDTNVEEVEEVSEEKEDAEEGNDESSSNGPDVSPLIFLDDLTGLNHVKEKLMTYEKVVQFNKKRTESGLSTSSSPLHAMFLGSPGTGKTTVAQLMGGMLHKAGVLSKGHVVVRERATLLGQFYHSEAEKTLEALEEAKGGILFIDEAYQLYQPNDPKDPGKFVIETLLTALADSTNRDWMLILAGYPEEMKRMFELNPGFKSRIPDSNIYTFDDFTEPELMEIAIKYLENLRYSLTPDAHRALSARLSADYRLREKSFGNARHVINLIETEILPSMATRVINDGINDARALIEIQRSDIPAPIQKAFPSRQRIGFSA